MAGSTPPRRVRRFGLFELDIESGELRKSGLKLKLQEQPLQVLAALLERPGEVVSREELQQRLWPDGTFVEFDHGLSTAVNRLRETLGDSAKSPRYVETVARRGYRFLGPVERLDGQGRTEPLVPPERSGKSRWLLMAAVVGAAAVSTWVWLTRPEPPPNYRFKQLTWDTGLTTDPAISPDGRLVAYASDRAGGDNLDIWVQQVAGGEPRRLTSHEAHDHSPSFSSDGSRVVFVSTRSGGGIYVASATGGHETLVAKTSILPLGAFEFQARFSPDDKWIAYHGGAPNSHAEICIVSANGGEPRVLTSGLSEALRPIWSPSGEHLLFLGNDTPEDSGFDWWVAPVDGGPAVKTGAFDVLRRAGLERLRPWPFWSVDYFWEPGGKQIVFSAKMGDSINLWRVPISPRSWTISGEPQRLTNGTGEVMGSTTTDGRIVFSSQRENHAIWALPIDSNQGKAMGEPARLTEGLAVESYPTVSDDGRKLVFTSNRSGNFDVWLKDLETGEEIPLTVTPEDEHRALLSPDGSKVVYRRQSEKGEDYDIHLVSLESGTSRKIVEGMSSILCWSSDGTRVLYYDRRRPVLWNTVDVTTGEIVDVITHPEHNVIVPKFSPDDRWITFWLGDGDGTPIYVAPVHDGIAGPHSEWIRIQDGPGHPWWSPDGGLLYTPSDRDGFWCIWAQPLDAVTKRPVGEPWAVWHLHGRLGSSGARIGYGMTKDMLYYTLRETTGNIWLAEPVG